MPPSRDESACFAKRLWRSEVKGALSSKTVLKRSLKDSLSSLLRVVTRDAELVIAKEGTCDLFW